MKKNLVKIAILFLVCISTTSNAQTNTKARSDLWDIVQQFNNDMVAEFNKGNYSSVAAFYSDTAVLYGPTSTIKGRAAIDQYWAGIKNPKSWLLTLLDCGGDKSSIWSHGISELIAYSDTGQEYTSAVNFIVIMKPEGGKYKIIIDMYTIYKRK